MSAAPTDTKSHLRLVPALHSSGTHSSPTHGSAGQSSSSMPSTSMLDTTGELSTVDNRALDPDVVDVTDDALSSDDRSRRAHPASIGAARAAAQTRERRARDLVQFPPELRSLRRNILADGLAHGRAISPDAVSVILAAKVVHQSPLLHFTEDIVWDLLWFDICNWCGLRRLEVPSGIVAAMWVTLQYLHQAGLLDAHSDTIEDLCTPLQSSGGLDPLGRTRFPG